MNILLSITYVAEEQGLIKKFITILVILRYKPCEFV